MLIIIEGPDGVGKTTYIEGLRNFLVGAYPFHRVEVIHKKVPTKHILDEFVLPLVDYRPGTDHHIIADRWHLSEWVYPQVVGRKTQADRALWYYIESFLLSKGAMYVHLTAPFGDIIKRLEARGDDAITTDMIPKLARGYTLMFGQHLTYHITYHVNGRVAPVDSYAWVSGQASYLENEVETASKFVTYIGDPAPNVLIVGDVRHNVNMLKPETFHNKPIFMPYPSTSGHYLFKHIPRQVFNWRTGFVNACDMDDLGKVVEALQPVQLLALGNNAAKRVEELGFVTGFGAVPHPQYVRRFHNHHGEQYGSTIFHAIQEQKDMRSWRP